jgi:hypothetical protein
MKYFAGIVEQASGEYTYDTTRFYECATIREVKKQHKNDCKYWWSDDPCEQDGGWWDHGETWSREGRLWEISHDTYKDMTSREDI